MSAAPTIADRAEALAEAGRVRDAVQILQSAAGSGDIDALFTLGVWLLAGRYLRRDLAGSRRFFAEAAAAGHSSARHVHLAFVANGTGAPPDWAQAVRLLEDLSGEDLDFGKQLRLIRKMALSPDGEPAEWGQPEALSDSPYLRLFRGFMSAEECDYLIEAAMPLLEPALVVDPGSGRLIQHPIRTADGAAFPLAQESPAIHAFNRRIAKASATQVSQGEPLQVLRYRPGQEYKAHVDALTGDDNQRIATMLVYLNDDYEGGETHFFANGLSVKGAKGDALLFRNVTADGRPDERARHAGLPVTKGVKLLASRWIRAKPLDLG